MELRERYFSVAETEWPVRRAGNLRYYLDYLFEGVDLQGARVLDIGAGGGRFTFYAAAMGASRVVALEPEAAGSDSGVSSQFANVRERLGVDGVELRNETLQTYDPGDERFDVLFMHASINHLDEPATMRLHHDESARASYRELFARLAGMGADGAKLVASDVSRHNLFARLPVRNPLQPTIEWDKHQPPETWVELLTEAGFTDPRVRWSAVNSLRRPGRVLLGNRVGAWLTEGSFCLTMTLRR
jgi:SAM-dependent methyltransferase